LPVDQLAFAVVQMVVVAVVGEHAKRSRLVVVPALFAWPTSVENIGNGQKGIEMAKRMIGSEFFNSTQRRCPPGRRQGGLAMNLPTTHGG
jgi:hypothetical protein